MVESLILPEEVAAVAAAASVGGEKNPREEVGAREREPDFVGK